ncbi:MAG: hypothetical protein AAFQ41_02605 [Cyanobacteria bacterium J06623_7]
MPHKIKVPRTYFCSPLLESNPQLFRELKGKLTTRNLVVAAALSVLVQFLTVIYFLAELPEASDRPIQYGSYGNALYEGAMYHTKDELGHWLVNWQVWWLDLFITLSFIGIFALLVVGTHMLVADLVRETNRGTLNFIRLSPQSAGSVLLGKILGVPILLYMAIVLLLPLHLSAGLQAHIPLGLILAFDAVVLASCGLVYCLALLWSLVNLGKSAMKSWLAAGILFFLLFSSKMILFQGYVRFDHTADSLLIFNPAIILSYLIEATPLNLGKSSHFAAVNNLSSLSFYGQTWWTNTAVGISLIWLNLSLWTYWCWSLLKRRFHNPQGTILNKQQSYWLTAWFIFIALGFTLQQNLLVDLDGPKAIADNFIFLQVCLSLFGLGLIFALTPQRQTLHDWARYRHQQRPRSSLVRELVLGENSPAIMAIALNLVIAIIFITPSIWLILPPEQHYFIWGFVLAATSVLFCAAIVQLVLLTKTNKRGIWSIVTVAALIIVPPVCLGITDLTIYRLPEAWLITLASLAAVEQTSVGATAWAICGQWLAITVMSLQTTRQLQRAGASTTKALMSQSVMDSNQLGSSS